MKHATYIGPIEHLEGKMIDTVEIDTDDFEALVTNSNRLADLIDQNARLRSALVGVVGTDEPDVLKMMRRNMVRILDASGCAPVMVAAIDILLETQP